MNPSKLYQNLSRHELRAALLGMVLGDANLQMRATNARLQMAHKPAAEDYVLLKLSILHQVPGVWVKYKEVRHQNRKLGKVYPSLRVWSGGHPFFTKMRERLYAPKKRINKGILASLTDLGFALWFMDDGHLSLHHNARRYKEDTGKAASERSISSRNYTINTHSFSQEENEMIVAWLLSKWGIEARVKEERRGGTFFIHVNTTNAKILADIVRPYVLAVPSMHYKIDFRYTEKSPELLRYNVQPWLDGTMEEGQECAAPVKERAVI